LEDDKRSDRSMDEEEKDIMSAPHKPVVTEEEKEHLITNKRNSRGI
jgi:hypothetical protein